MTYDFGGYATKAGVRCLDGRTIMPKAFEHQNGTTLPLIWSHNDKDPNSVLGNVVLEQRADGVYAHGSLNNTPNAEVMRELLKHGDIDGLSIRAIRLQETDAGVVHRGDLVEVSFVAKGANPEAKIEYINLEHSAETSDEVIMFVGGDDLVLEHSANNIGKNTMADEQTTIDQIRALLGLQHEDAGDQADPPPPEDKKKPEDDEDKTVGDVLDTFNEEQLKALEILLAEAVKAGAEEGSDAEGNAEGDPSSDEEKKKKEEDAQNSSEVKHSATSVRNSTMANVFDIDNDNNTKKKTKALSHSAIEEIFKGARSNDSLKASAENYALSHGIDNISELFPDPTDPTGPEPQIISEDLAWVANVMSGVKTSPFSRIKTVFTDMTPDEARAKGYIKGHYKKEQFIKMAKRVTTPTMVYKKQKVDRQDILEITDFNMVAWVKGELAVKLREEIARAVLVGDGRPVSDDDKIDETSIRAIASDDEVFQTTLNVPFNPTATSSEAIIDALITGRRYYKGSGEPTLYISETALSQILMVRDGVGRRIYTSIEDVKAACRVKDVVTSYIFDESRFLGVVVNLQDYTFGVPRGGEETMFDDFDINYNALLFLLETFRAGALTKPKAALVLRKTDDPNPSLVVPIAPTRIGNTVYIPEVTIGSIEYMVDGNPADPNDEFVLVEGQTLSIEAHAGSGYYFANSAIDNWTFTYEA